MSIRPAVKTHGGKKYLAQWLISNFPENYTEMTYLEPYCGGANVLLQKEKSNIEVINDLDLNTIQVYRALRDESKEFIKRLKTLKYSQETFDTALDVDQFDDYIDHAVNEVILRRMSRGGLRKTFAWSNRLRGGQPGDVNAWNTAIAGFSDISKRLKEVYVFNKPALEIMRIFNSPDTLVYCDPPYLHETRVSKTVYSSEMSTDEHIQLAHTLMAFDGKAVISGYMSPLYNRLYKDWNIEKKKVANNASQQKNKEQKIEVLWKNF